MKTKARKLREMMARYIYNRLQSYYYIEEMKVIFGNNDWFIDTGGSKCPRDYLFEWGDIEQSLGIIICLPLGEINGTVMWDKEKEEKYAKMCQEEAKKKKYTVIHYKPWIPTVYPPVHSQIWHNEFVSKTREK